MGTHKVTQTKLITGTQTVTQTQLITGTHTVTYPLGVEHKQLTTGTHTMTYPSVAQLIMGTLTHGDAGQKKHHLNL